MSILSEQDGSLPNDNNTAFDAEAAFLKHFTSKDADAEKPSGKAEDEEDKRVPQDTDDTADDSAQNEPDEAEGDEGGDEDETPQKKYADSDDVYVKVKVGEEEHEASIKDLKRLYGQETALNQKSQQVAEARKAAEAEHERYVTGVASMLDRAKARFEPYAKIDFLLASQQLSAEEYTALRNEATAAYNDVQFLTSELDGTVKQIAEKAQQTLRETAVATIKTLSGDPKDGGIEGWNDKLYDDIRSYGVSQGIDKDAMNRLVDAPALRLIHKAMLFDRGKSKVVTTKVNKTPKKVVKSSANPDEVRKITKGAPSVKANARLLKEGSIDAATDAFMVSWGVNS
jgi:hypothetical protein